MNKMINSKLANKIRGVIFDIFIFTMLFFMACTIYEINRSYEIIKINQPFITGKIIDGKFVPCKEFKLGDRIYTEFNGEKLLPFYGTVYLVIEDTFRYELKSYEINCPVGKIENKTTSVPTSSWWTPGIYKVVGTLVYKDVGLFKRTITYNLESEAFELR